MAVLSKIRERSVFLIIIIALALFSFVLSGIFDNNSPLFNKNVENIGEVNGDPITREDFVQEVESIRSRSNGRSNEMMNVDIAWNNLVRQKLYKSQLDKSGIVVGEKDIWDAIVSQVQMQNSPMFLNEVGMFDEEKLKEYVATLKESANDSEQDKLAWLNWLNYEKNVKANLEQNTYNSLVNAGLSSTNKEAERDYTFKNTNVDIDYVYVPFSTIPDSLVQITEGDIKSYIKTHSKDYPTDASRDIQFVSFNVAPSAEDEEAIKQELINMIKNREEYSNAAKTTVTLTGFSEAANLTDFFSTNSSDTPLDQNFYTASKLTPILRDSLFNREINKVYGPYKENGFYKLSKVTAVKQLPDSVKASHILIPFAGSAVADPTVTMNSEEAKIYADSLYNAIKTDKTKFENFAKDLSADKVSGEKGGDLGWFVYTTMIPEFRDYVFENKVGDLGVVKSQFGYHIIRIDGQKNPQANVQIATFSRKIEASETTENNVFENAETFASDLSSGKEITELAKEKGYFVMPVMNLKEFDHNVSSLGSQRQIVRWLYEDGTSEGDVKRFDVENGYAVVRLNKINKKGTHSATTVQSVRAKLINDKKVDIIKERSNGSLADIASQNNTEIKSAMAVSPASPVLPGEGRFVNVAGIATQLNENSDPHTVTDQTGVVFVQVKKKTSPTVLENYMNNKQTLERQLKSRNLQVYNSIKENAEIEDNRAVFY